MTEPTFPTFAAPPRTGPQLHVLAIGAGSYPYLVRTPEGDSAPNPLSLSQLTSPPRSVKALVEFFCGIPFDKDLPAYSNPDLPLGSVWALASATTPIEVMTPNGAEQVTLRQATLKNISEAFEQWLEAMCTHAENVGIFYFCGHGVTVENQYLLASDFGERRLTPWSNAFDLEYTIQAINRTVKGSVYYFIDACREFSKAMALTRGGEPAALKAPNISQPVVRTSTTVIRATGEGELAFSEANNVSRFTTALLMVMSGYCGDRPPASDYWEVNGANLSDAVWKYLKFSSPEDQLQTSEQTTNGKAAVALVKHSNEPKVKVRIDLRPPGMASQVSVFVRGAANASWEPQSLNFDTSKGYYDIQLAPTGAGAFAERHLTKQEIFPPAFKLPVELP